MDTETFSWWYCCAQTLSNLRDLWETGVERGGSWLLWLWPGDNCWAQHWGHGPALLPPPSAHPAPPASPLSSDKLGNSQMVGGLHLHTTLFIQHNQTNNSLFHLSDYILLPPSMLGTSWWIRRLRADLLPNLTNWRILFWHLREVFLYKIMTIAAIKIIWWLEIITSPVHWQLGRGCEKYIHENSALRIC